MCSFPRVPPEIGPGSNASVPKWATWELALAGNAGYEPLGDKPLDLVICMWQGHVTLFARLNSNISASVPEEYDFPEGIGAFPSDSQNYYTVGSY